MKPTSIIFLIISVLLVIGGFTTMGVAKKLAAEEGVELVAEISEGNEDYVFQYEYAQDNVGKIAVSVKNAKVNVYGGASNCVLRRRRASNRRRRADGGWNSPRNLACCR